MLNKYKMERIGQVRKNNNGSLMKIVIYDNANDIWVKFENSKLVHTHWEHFKNGKVKNPYDRTVVGIGYIGEGNYSSKENGKNSNKYIAWRHMLERCYGEKQNKLFPTYIYCSVIEDWHNYQNFATWWDQNYYEVNKERMHLDKDILIKGNKIYSPETCIFVPHSINCLFLKSDSTRGEFPIGVSWDKIEKMYKAQCNNGKGKNVHIGLYSTPEKAFQAYKTYKENLIKQIAKDYESKIPPKLYEAMINYVVEIDD